MKRVKSKIQLAKMLGAGVVLAGAVALNGTVAKAANDVYNVAIDECFPDPVFNEYVKEHCDQNGDGILSAIERSNTKTIDCSGTEAQNGGIKSLEGIQYFSNLSVLKCDHNQITGLDILGIETLEELYCNDNPLKTLKINKNEKDEYWDDCLGTVVCHNCELGELNIIGSWLMEDIFEKGTVTTAQNILTFSRYYRILKIDKGVKIIADEWEMRNPDSVTVSANAILIEKGKPQKLRVTVLPEYANQTVTWSSDNTEVATVDANGNVTFRGIGTAIITANTVNGLTASCDVTCLVENIESNPFADVASDNWAFASMKDMLDKKIMVGTGELAGKIVSGCDNVLTRAQFARILYSMEKEPAVEYSPVFSDVPEGAWYTNAIIWANANELIVGKGGYFDIDAPATREQIATILKRYAEFKGLDDSVAEGIDEKIAGFSDKGSISSWAQEGMAWVVAKEVVTGKPGVILEPSGNAKRSECAAMITRFLDGAK